MPNNTPSRGESIALGRLPKHAIEATEQLRSLTGVTSAHFDPKTGNAVWTDRNGRNALLRYNNAIDREAGYGDHSG
jgi:hypothetical protein